MSEIDYGFNIEAVLNRMMVATKSRSLSKMGESLGLSINALGQSKQRGSIALTTLLKCQKLASEVGNVVSLDYLVHGEGEDEKIIKNPHEESDEDRYVKIDERRGYPGLKFERNWLQRLMVTKGVEDISSLYYYEVIDNIWIINTSDKIVRKGIYAFGNPNMPAIRPCEQHISGKMIVSGETTPQTQEELEAIGVIGRVIWDGISV